MDNFEEGSAPGFDQAPEQEPLLDVSGGGYGGYGYGQGTGGYGAVPSAEIRQWRAPVIFICGYFAPMDILACLYATFLPWCNFGGVVFLLLALLTINLTVRHKSESRWLQQSVVRPSHTSTWKVFLAGMRGWLKHVGSEKQQAVGIGPPLHNMKRALKSSAVIETALALFFSVVVLLTVHITINTVCPIPEDREEIPDLPGFDEDDPNPLCVPGFVTFFSRSACFEPGTYCYNVQYARYVAPFMMFLFYCYVAYRRYQVRYRHGLPGRWWTDFCYEQWCCLCTMCQETRTYWFYNVQDGEWLGQVYKSVDGVYYDDPDDV